MNGSAFERLAQTDDHGLDALFQRGAAPSFEALAGFQWRGFNTDPKLRLLGLRRFIKAFFRTDEGREGCNIKVAQGGLVGPWRPLLRDGRLDPFAYYLVSPQDGRTRLARNPAALVIDYAASPRNPAYHVERLIRDYLVQPFEEPEVLLGRAYLGFGRSRIGSSFFVLERLAPLPADFVALVSGTRRRRAP